jgi:hypothetical protein
MSVLPTITKYGIDYLGNKNTTEVHRIADEKPQCQIDEILSAGNAVKFIPDTLKEAHNNGYDNCAYCIGGSRR